jgi:hypothetical protein
LTTLEQKQKQNIHYYNFVEVAGWLPAVADQRLKEAGNIIKNLEDISGLLLFRMHLIPFQGSYGN